MRLAAQYESPNFYGQILMDRGFDNIHELTVTVDGVTHNDIIEADNVEGWADILAHDEHGHIVAGKDGVPPIVRMYGTVEFRVGDVVLT